MKKGGNPQNFKGKNFAAHPENINRKGRPKKLPGLVEMLEEVLGDDGSGESEAIAIIRRMSMKARNGDVRAAELLLDRSYGKVIQKIDASITTPEMPTVIVKLNKDGD